MIISEWLGQSDYLETWDRQKGLVAEHRSAVDTLDKLLFVEHPPTYTLGSSGKKEHLLINEAQLAAEEIAVYKVNRGGDITYHGPGQFVAYPIFNLRRRSKAQGYSKFSVHTFVRDLEEVIIQMISQFGILGWRYPGYTGVWVGAESDPRKIAAIGINVSRGISSHGFALNVNPNMAHFKHIIPCGIREHEVTSMSQELNQELALTDLIPAATLAFQQIYKDNVVASQKIR
ncbi:MAG: lipoyl(octanoyl) transferase [Cellvibrionaceae bacterium]|jgi:lipoyl(octanoyl) transferase